MKILMVSRFFPYPKVTHSGGTDLFHYIEALQARGHQIALASYIMPAEQEYLHSMRPYCSVIETVPAISPWGQRLAKAPYLLAYPQQWVEAFSRPMRQVIQNLLSQQHYDLVHFEHLWTAQYLDLVQGSATALDEVDVDSIVLFRRSRRARSWLLRRYLRWCWLRTVQLEVDACEKMDLVFTRSDKDRKYLQCLAPDRNIRVLPPWFEGVQKTVLPLDHIEPRSLLFVGNMSRGPNIEAVVYFCEGIFPRVLQAIPDAHLYVVGDDPPSRIMHLSSDHITVTGYVQDLQPYYARCQVFVAPLLIGGGIIVKILDALAAGRPVVTTSIGNEGIEAVPGRDLHVADTSELFTDRVIDLLTSTQHWREMSQHGRRFVEQKYQWSTIIDDLEDAYARLLQAI